MSDPVPAITEAGATGEIAKIFADIRSVLGVDVVNLIWRHLAIIPGALPWSWAALRPLYVDGTIAAEAAALHDDLDFPRLPPFPPEAFAAASLLDEDIRTIRNVLAAYDRTNAMAIVALSALLLRLDGERLALDTVLPHDGAAFDEPPPIPLPSLLNIADLPAATAELVLTLNRLGSRQDHPILASMYRHLAHWPTYLALTWAIIAPLDADGSLGRLIADAIAKARTAAARIAMQLPSPSVVPIAPAIRAAIEPFTEDVLGKMVVICAVLRAVSGHS